MHYEHDMALAYLERSPENVAPIPVVTSISYLAGVPWVEEYLWNRPYVTHVGYGLGLTEWEKPVGDALGGDHIGPTDKFGEPVEELPLPMRGRDMGTAQVVSTEHEEFRRDDCHRGRVEDGAKAAIVTSPMSKPDVSIGGGDSGGAVLIGPGPVVGDMTLPNHLPVAIEPRRYLAGVHSRNDFSLVSTGECSEDSDCMSGWACALGFGDSGECTLRCELDEDCVDLGGYCGGTRHCMRPVSISAPTYTAENGNWIEQALNDIDGDGTPNDEDNCPGVYNDQANTNEDAERDRQAEPLGDACDPTPIPKVRVVQTGSVTIDPPNGECSGVKQGRVLKNRIVPATLGSRNLINGTLRVQNNQVTEFRFCEPDPLAGRHCDVDNRQRTDGGFDEADNEHSKWRPVTLDELGATGASTMWDYPWSVFKMKPTLTWDYWNDLARWRKDGWVKREEGFKPRPPWILDTSWQQSSEINGVFGIRAGGARSATLLGTITNYKNGVHFTPDLGDGYKMGEGLGRYYFDLEPDPIRITGIQRCLRCVGDCRIIDINVTKLIDYHRQLITDPRHAIDIPDRASLIKGELGWSFVGNDGSVIHAPGLIDSTLDSYLTSDQWRYVPAVETFIAQGINYRQVQGVIIDQHATDIVDSVVAGSNGMSLLHHQPAAMQQLTQANSQLGGAYESDEFPTNMGDNARPAESINMALDSQRINSPSRPVAIGPAGQVLDGMAARTDFTAVFSRVLGALVVVGGRHLDGTLTNEIWMIAGDSAPVAEADNLARRADMESMASDRMVGINQAPTAMGVREAMPKKLFVPGYQPEEVIAATVATRDRMLWVLDDMTVDNVITTRLVRINPKSLQHEVVWQGSKSGEFDGHWLVIDRDGHVLLVSSSSAFNKHVTVKIQATPHMFGTAKPTLVRLGQGALLSAPTVDSDGYTFLTRSGQTEIAPLRVDELEHNAQQGMGLESCL